MALAHDASSPAFSVSGYFGTTNASQASNSFSPPAGSLVVVVALVQNSYGPNGWGISPTIVDSATALTWTLQEWETNPSTSGGIAIFTAPVVGAPGSITATVTAYGGASADIGAIDVAVDVWTGAKNSGPIGALIAGYSTSASLSVTLTPQATGSAMMLAVADNQANETVTVGSGCYMTAANVYYQANQEWYGASGGPSLSTTGQLSTGQALAMSGLTAAAIVSVAYEVLAAGGGGGGGGGSSAGLLTFT